MCRAFGDAVDLKSPFHHGHAAGVAELAAGAAERMGLAAEDVVRVRRAGYLHDLGRAAIPNGVWEKPGPLTSAEWERVRLRPYHSERILNGSAALQPLARLAGMHHERLDGSGYHREAAASGHPDAGPAACGRRRVPGDDAATRPPARAGSRGGRRRALGRRRARPARSPGGGGGARARRPRRAAPAGASRDRPARASRPIAEHHVQDIYARIGVSTRAGAALYAMQNDLLA